MSMYVCIQDNLLRRDRSGEGGRGGAFSDSAFDQQGTAEERPASGRPHQCFYPTHSLGRKCVFVCLFFCLCVCVCVSLFHWLQAEKFDGSGHPVLVVRGCKVTDWNGASANFLLIFFPTPTHATPPPQDVRWESQATHKLSSTLHDQRRMFCEGGLMGWGRL